MSIVLLLKIAILYNMIKLIMFLNFVIHRNYRMIYLNMGHGDEEYIDATQNLLFVNAFRWVVSQDPDGDPFDR